MRVYEARLVYEATLFEVGNIALNAPDRVYAYMRDILELHPMQEVFYVNHPSGDPAPSAPDLHVTRQLREPARTVDIALLDHVILGWPECDPLTLGYFSFRSSGLL